MTKDRSDMHTHDYLVGTVRTVVNPARTGFGYSGPVTSVMYLPHGLGTAVWLRFWNADLSQVHQALLDDTREGVWRVSEPVKVEAAR